MSFLASRLNKASNRRRSQRILLSITICVEGQTSAGQTFTEITKTAVVNAHGAAILLRHAVSLGANLKITNVKTGEISMATVVDIPNGAEAGAEVGIELKEPSPRFWRVAFPPEDWTPRSAEAKRFDSKPVEDSNRH